jgi:hypothetical protein
LGLIANSGYNIKEGIEYYILSRHGFCFREGGNTAPLSHHLLPDGLVSGLTSMNTNYLEEYQKYLAEWQKMLLSAWGNGLPTTTPVFEFPETLVKSLEYQQEWVKSYLTAQETATKVALDSQKQFWDSYFGFARQSMAVINKPA